MEAQAPAPSASTKARIDLKPLLESKPFILIACVSGGFLIVAIMVGLMLSRPLPKGKDKLPDLTDLAALQDFKLPDFPERFETVDFSRDTDGRADPDELSAYYYSCGSETREEAKSLARQAVEEFYEGIE
jgi:hypothetical protein